MTVPQVRCGWPSPATLTHKGPDGQLSAEQHPDLLKLGCELLSPRLLIPQQGFCPLQLRLQLRAKHLESGAGRHSGPPNPALPRTRGVAWALQLISPGGSGAQLLGKGAG